MKKNEEFFNDSHSEEIFNGKKGEVGEVLKSFFVKRKVLNGSNYKLK